MEGWSKIAAGVALGIAGTVYATNRKVREKLPDAARDLPDSVRRRFDRAVNAAREASESRREEILKDLSRHSAAHPPRPARPEPPGAGGPTDEARNTETHQPRGETHQ
ncbi:hypothetical protein [Rubrobacter indicoceani]|uniref:hypothetical protein n=1 Tax=Rubrobacter indicoceani TaxID=2051957 RepID=UPI000E5B8063|nr:hypothetical protein [Rubrobacter indicoceani]